ncbi:hypothetical protein V8G54_024966, partial [Vigna mungo]
LFHYFVIILILIQKRKRKQEDSTCSFSFSTLIFPINSTVRRYMLRNHWLSTFLLLQRLKYRYTTTPKLQLLIIYSNKSFYFLIIAYSKLNIIYRTCPSNEDNHIHKHIYNFEDIERNIQFRDIDPDNSHYNCICIHMDPILAYIFFLALLHLFLK